jgi:hypothetical protein
VLDRGDDVAGRRVEDEHAAFGRGGHVHVVDADAGAADHGQSWSRLEESRVDLGRAAHEERVGVGERLEELLARRAGEVDDFVAGRLKHVEPGRRDLLGDDDPAHEETRTSSGPLRGPWK